MALSPNDTGKPVHTPRPASGPMRIIRLNATQTAHRNITQAIAFIRDTLAGQGVKEYDKQNRQWIVTELCHECHK